MGRWQPDARGRLGHAAFELFSERGYEQTTAAQIAERAGLTERTFFRHYTDKREVLFAGSDALQEFFVEALAATPEAAAPIDAVALALEAVGSRFFGAERREFSRQRGAVIMANAELRERELIKLASLSSAMARTLRDRGTAEPSASLAAEAGMAVFKVSFERWLTAGREHQGLTDFVQESLRDLKSVTAGNG